MNEEQIHRDAWNLYFELRQQGKSKSEAVAGAASECGRSESTIWEWKKKFNWDERESIRAATINQKVEERLNEQLVDLKVQYLKLLNDLIFEVLEERRSKSRDAVKIKSIPDLERVINMALLLIGEIGEERTEEKEEAEYDTELLQEIGRKLIEERKKRRGHDHLH
ncbi:MAG TPA: hypothetical protein HA298_05320 [Methanobacteriales archaeon]|jgi:Putative ATPase subunit of terminase (gpP-like).|nr:hypothetical protein [Methanobacteriaceae archaeon]MBC7096071.1 hypothetical protein [Methanobacteriales archaeon]HIH62087.1 hypothetical protein [Methanobacteriales archaeon]